jgi:hypothetical protein
MPCAESWTFTSGTNLRCWGAIVACDCEVSSCFLSLMEFLYSVEDCASLGASVWKYEC